MKFVVLLSLFPLMASASTAQSEAPFAQEYLFDTAKRYILNSSPMTKEGKSSIFLEDRSAGLIRFEYRDVGFTDPQATIEVIEIDPGHSRIRAELKSEYGGRSQLLIDKIISAAQRMIDGNMGQIISHPPKAVYGSVLRYLLKTYVHRGQKKEDVVKIASDDAGYIRFVYTHRKFRDPNVTIEIIPIEQKSSRLVVTVPSDPTVQGSLLQGELVRALHADLIEPTEPSESSGL